MDSRTDLPARALIAEDEPLLGDHLKAELQALWPALDIVASVPNGRQALAQGLSLQPDVCFLDIRMPGMSGLEAAQALVEDWPGGAARPLPLLVFVTAYDQYALQAFERQACDYLLKPVQTERLLACVQRLQARLAERRTGPAMPASAGAVEPVAPADGTPDPLAALRGLIEQLGAGTGTATPRLQVIQAQVGNTVHLVPLSEVLYFEAADKYVRVLTAEREHLIRLTLRELLPQLDPQRWWQVHRGTVVRADAIARAERDEAGRVHLHLRQRAERLGVSRLYAHLFRGM